MVKRIGEGVVKLGKKGLRKRLLSLKRRKKIKGSIGGKLRMISNVWDGN